MSRLVDRRLVRQVPAMRRLLPVLGAIQLAAALAIVVQAGLLADLIVRIFDHSAGAHAVLDEVGLLVGVGAARAGLAALQEWVVGRASLTVRSELRARTLAAVVALGPLWVRRQPAGRVLTATGPGLDALDGYVTRALPAAVAAMVVPPVVLVRIGLADWSSAVILAVLLPLVPLFLALVGITTHRHVQRQYAALGQLAGRFVDLLRGLTTLRIYGRAEAQEEALRRVTDSYRQRTLATLRVAFLSGLVLDLLAALSVAVVAVDVGLRLDGGHVSLATALLVLLLAPELFAPLRAVGAHHHATEEGTTAAVAALDIVDEAVEGRPASTGSLHVTTGGSEFDGVTV
ncbi:MAG: ABC transporter, partial [Actinobacteria bacterium]|nr:ABC transporter [Actinomycetota bacterium]